LGNAAYAFPNLIPHLATGMNQAQICNLLGKTVASEKLLHKKCFSLQSAIKKRLKIKNLRP